VLSQILLKLAIRDRPQGRLREEFLPPPGNQQRDQKIDNKEAPLWTLFIDFGRLLDRQRYARLFFHWVNVTRTAR
jgi:hypothetical protein